MSIELVPEGAVVVRSVPPYDTGKVKIGLAYIPRQKSVSDPDLDWLQGVLLSGSRSVVRGTWWEEAGRRFRDFLVSWY